MQPTNIGHDFGDVADFGCIGKVMFLERELIYDLEVDGIHIGIIQ
jgi:hypothetical protein